MSPEYNLPLSPVRFVPGKNPINGSLAKKPIAPDFSAAGEAAFPAIEAETATVAVVDQPVAQVIKLTEAQIQRETILAEIEACRLSVAEKIAEPLPRLYLAGKQVATEDNLVAIVAKAGTGKSAAVGGAYAAAIAAAIGSDADTLGFSAENINRQAVVVIDTEQARYDAQLCIKRALRRADTDDAPAWLETFSLVGKSRAWRRAALRPILEAASVAHEGIFAVYLDGVADLVNNVNDIEECIAVIAELRQLSIDFHCPIICVIHSNEGEAASDKPRGHIGSELMREAETVILLKRDGNTTVVTTHKQRKAPVTAADGIAFKWSDDEMRHVSCGSPAVAKQQAKNDKLRDLAIKCFGTSKVMSRGALEEAIRIHAAVSGDTPRRRVNEMLTKVLINKRSDGTYAIAGA